MSDHYHLVLLHTVGYAGIILMLMRIGLAVCRIGSVIEARLTKGNEDSVLGKEKELTHGE